MEYKNDELLATMTKLSKAEIIAILKAKKEAALALAKKKAEEETSKTSSPITPAVQATTPATNPPKLKKRKLDSSTAVEKLKKKKVKSVKALAAQEPAEKEVRQKIATSQVPSVKGVSIQEPSEEQARRMIIRPGNVFVSSSDEEDFGVGDGSKRPFEGQDNPITLPESIPIFVEETSSIMGEEMVLALRNNEEDEDIFREYKSIRESPHRSISSPDEEFVAGDEPLQTEGDLNHRTRSAVVSNKASTSSEIFPFSDEIKTPPCLKIADFRFDGESEKLTKALDHVFQERYGENPQIRDDFYDLSLEDQAALKYYRLPYQRESKIIPAAERLRGTMALHKTFMEQIDEVLQENFQKTMELNLAKLRGKVFIDVFKAGKLQIDKAEKLAAESVKKASEASTSAELYKAELLKVQGEVDRLKVELEEVRTAKSSADVEVESLRDLNINLEDEVKHLKDDVEHLRAENDELSTITSTLEDTNSKFIQELSAKDVCIQELQGTRTSLARSLLNLRKSFSSILEENLLKFRNFVEFQYEVCAEAILYYARGWNHCAKKVFEKFNISIGSADDEENKDLSGQFSPDLGNDIYTPISLPEDSWSEAELMKLANLDSTSTSSLDKPEDSIPDKM